MRQDLSPIRPAGASNDIFPLASSFGAPDRLRFGWDHRAACTGNSALIFWGRKEIALRKKELERWKSELVEIRVGRHDLGSLDGIAHYRGGK